MRRTGFASSGRDADVQLYWEQWSPETGAGAPLLLVNGLGSPCVAYEQGLIEQFVDAGFDVVRFDNRDVGRSTRCPGERTSEATYRLADMAADATAVLDAVGWERAHVLGQSMGGMIAQQMAIDSPDRLRSMISLMSTTGARGVGRSTDEALAALTMPAPVERSAWLEARVRTERLWASPEYWDEAWVRSKGAAMWDHGAPTAEAAREPIGAGVGRQFRAVQASGPRDHALPAVVVPTLVLHGTADTLIGIDGGRHTAALIPGAQMVEIEGMGHDLPPALWARLVEDVRRFVQDLDRL